MRFTRLSILSINLFYGEFGCHDSFFAKHYRHYQRNTGTCIFVAPPFGRQTQMSWPDNDMI